MNIVGTEKQHISEGSVCPDYLEVTTAVVVSVG